MFQVGDKVVHPMHGAGVIDSIAREKISGKAMDFYVFKMPISGLTLKIPSRFISELPKISFIINVRPVYNKLFPILL